MYKKLNFLNKLNHHFGIPFFIFDFFNSTYLLLLSLKTDSNTILFIVIFFFRAFW